MRLEPEHLDPDAFVDPHWLSPRVLRLRFAPGRRVPVYLEALLHDRAADTILPDAPNRIGIAQTLEELRERYAQALALWRGEPVATAEPVVVKRRWGWLRRRPAAETAPPAQAASHPARELADVQALIRRTLAHLRAPDAIYCNGSHALTAITLAGGRVELAAHASLRELIHACSDHSPCLPLLPDQCTWHVDREAAEIAAHAALCHVVWTEIATSDADGGAPHEDSVWLDAGGPRRDWILRHAGSETRIELGHDGDPRAALRALDLGGRVVRCCASCAHFQRSGMSDQMSSGEAGYCRQREADLAARGEVPSPFDRTWANGLLTHVLNLCGNWSLHRDWRAP